MVDSAVISAIGGVLFGGVVCVAGLVMIVYPGQTYHFLRGWQFDEPPDLSEKALLDQRGAGAVIVITGLVIALHSLP